MNSLGSGFAAPRPATPVLAPDVMAGATDPMARELDLRRLAKVLWRRRRLFLMVFAGFFIAVALFTFLKPRQYTTQVKLIAGSAGGFHSGSETDENEAGTQLPVLNALMAASGVQSAETYAELIQQTPVAQEVASDLGLHVGAGLLLSRLTVRPVTNTSILGIAVAWSDPVTSAKIANQFATVFVEHERQLIAHQADSAITFLQQELPEAERRMRATQEALSAYQERTGIADLPTQTANDISTVSSIEAKESQAELDEHQAQATLASVQADLASTPATIVGSQTVSQNPIVTQLQTQISTLTMQLNTARKQYTDDHPTVIGLKSQLAEAQRELKAQPQAVVAGTATIPNPVYQQLTQQAATLQAQIASAQALAATLKAQRERVRPTLEALPDQSRRIGELQRSAKSSEGIYDALQRRYQDALITRTTALSDVSITQQASPDVFSVSPNVLFNLTVGLILGLALGVTAVFGAEFFDDRFRNEDDVKERLGLPVLAQIPQLEAGDWKANAWVKPLSIEAFYQLVASLRYSSGSPPHTILFTSADQGDGKSTVAVNTAVSMGMMSARVLIVDADLRRPTVHQKLNVTNDRGLSDVLVGLAPFPETVKATEHPGVWVLTSGRPAPNPVSLLQSQGFERLLKRARERFDFVIVDGPALRSIVDPVVLGNKVEGTVLVINSARSEGRAVFGALAKLRSVGLVNVLGVVLNGVKPDAREYTDYYLGAGQSIALPTKTAG